VTVESHVEEIDDQPIRWLTAPGGDPPVLYLHGVPDAAEQWEPFLERTGGLAPDLPGFGR
jgi:pimeloyl-ACP methyl ester carboxylesterase